jgi:hypothetical protein
MPLPDEPLHAAVTRSWGREVREDLQELDVNRTSICFVIERALTQSLTSGRKELLAGIMPFSP